MFPPAGQEHLDTLVLWWLGSQMDSSGPTQRYYHVGPLIHVFLPLLVSPSHCLCQSGVSVLAQLLHAEPVVKITCMASSMTQRKTAAGQVCVCVCACVLVCVCGMCGCACMHVYVCVRPGID